MTNMNPSPADVTPATRATFAAEWHANTRATVAAILANCAAGHVWINEVSMTRHVCEFATIASANETHASANPDATPAQLATIRAYTAAMIADAAAARRAILDTVPGIITRETVGYNAELSAHIAAGLPVKWMQKPGAPELAREFNHFRQYPNGREKPVSDLPECPAAIQAIQ